MAGISFDSKPIFGLTLAFGAFAQLPTFSSYPSFVGTSS
jgi:hypothetical protein